MKRTLESHSEALHVTIQGDAPSGRLSILLLQFYFTIASSLKREKNIS